VRVYDPVVARPRILLVHGSVVNADATWSAQRPLAERYDVLAPNRRGFPPGPEMDRVDYEDEAVWLDRFLEPGTHLVGHSYGGVIALFAAARRPEFVRSLTVVEPPAMAIVRDDPATEAGVESMERHWEHGPRDPEAFLRGFLARVGAPAPHGRFSPELLQGARLLMTERYPWRAVIPLDALAAAPFPKLAVSGGHSPGFEAVCDTLRGRIGALRAILPGERHAVQRLGAPFNDLLAAFVERAEATTTVSDTETPPGV